MISPEARLYGQFLKMKMEPEYFMCVFIFLRVGGLLYAPPVLVFLNLYPPKYHDLYQPPSNGASDGNKHRLPEEIQ